MAKLNVRGSEIVANVRVPPGFPIAYSNSSAFLLSRATIELWSTALGSVLGTSGTVVAVTTFSTSTVMILSTSTGLSTSTVTILSTSTGFSISTVMTFCTSFSTTCVTTRSTATSLSTTTTLSSITTCGSQAARIGSVAIAPRPARNDRRRNLWAKIVLNI